MECNFEDLITQQFPPFYQPMVKQGVKYIEQNATMIVKVGAEVAKEIGNLHPAAHSDKLTHFTKFADFVHKQLESPDKCKADDVFQYVGDHWNKFSGNCDNELNSIGGDDVKTMLDTCLEEIQKAMKKMFSDNLKIQGAVIAAQYALLWYLWAQSKRTDTIIQQSQVKLDKIREEYIIPSMKLMYIQDAEQDEEKYTSLKQDISVKDREMVSVYLKCASDRLQDSIEALEDQKQASMINAAVGGLATVISMWFTGGLLSGTTSLYNSNATFGTTLFYQQVTFTALSGGATVGLAWMTCKHVWNVQRCMDVLGKMKEMKQKADEEKAKLDLLLQELTRER